MKKYLLIIVLVVITWRVEAQNENLNNQKNILLTIPVQKKQDNNTQKIIVPEKDYSSSKLLNDQFKYQNQRQKAQQDFRQSQNNWNIQNNQKVQQQRQQQNFHDKMIYQNAQYYREQRSLISRQSIYYKRY